MAEDGTSLDDIVLALQNAQAPAAAPAPASGPGLPMNIVPAGANAATPAAPSTVPGPGGYSPADRFNKFSLPAGGGPLSVDDANKVIASYESTGGRAFAPADPTAPAAPTRAKAAGDDWSPPVAVMTPPPVTPVPMGPSMGMLAALPRPVVPAMGGVLAVPQTRR